MRMHPLHDKDLDRLSRNAAEHYEMDFGPSGWERLEKRLDQELPQKKRRRFLFWLFFIAITTGGALTGLLINSQPVVPLASNRIEAMPEKVNTSTARNDNTVRVATPEATKEKPGLTEVNKKPAIANHTTETPDLVKPIRANSATTVKKPVTRSSSPVEENDDVTSMETQPETTGTAVAKNKPETNVPATTNTKTENKPPIPDSTVAEKQPPIPHTYKQPLEIGLVAGPDVSMVSFGPLYKAGYNFGITVGYRFNNRWSVNTGAIYTRKYYQADSNTFTAPKHTYIAYVDLDVLKGYCAMWDIPVNVRYDFSFNDKRRFFASAGASTYLMKHQSYDYWYWQRGTGNYKDSAWGSSNSKQYVFSVLNLSLGYEKKISKHFSIQAEPYLKIPLQGLGYGDMKIGSYGMFFSLKYRPVFKAK